MISVRMAVSAGCVATVGIAEPVDAVGQEDLATQATSVTIAAGRVGGLYHPVGGAICALFNDNREADGISCTVEITGGSIPNIKDLREGDVVECFEVEMVPG